jgi:hypothetical protein
MIKPRKMIWARNEPYTGGREMYVGFWWESQKERNHYEDLDVDGRMIIRWILEK